MKTAEELAKQRYGKHREYEIRLRAEDRPERFPQVLDNMWSTLDDEVKKYIIQDAEADIAFLEIPKPVEPTPVEEKDWKEEIYNLTEKDLLRWPNVPVIPLPFRQDNVTGETLIHVQPMVYVKGFRLQVWDECAAAFDITDMRVGNRSIVMGESLPASMFAWIGADDEEKGVRLDIPTCTPAERIILGVRNNRPQARTFRAVLWCLQAPVDCRPKGRPRIKPHNPITGEPYGPLYGDYGFDDEPIPGIDP